MIDTEAHFHCSQITVLQYYSTVQLSTFSRKNEITIPRLQPRKATELTYKLNGCENNLTRRGVDTLGLLLLYEIDLELTRATHDSEIQSKTTFTLSIY